MDYTVDILEDSILKYGESVLEMLLKDKTTQKNIIWATNDYEKFGYLFKAHREITTGLVTGMYSKLIQPRVTKAKEHQDNRTKVKAEVFTPSWVCNEQNNLVDEQWFGRKDVFNIAKSGEWETIKDKIFFPDEKHKSWKNYVDARRLEVSCGEAPYLVSRYDAVSGEIIPVNERIGLLDRKFRVINENLEDEDAWMLWVIRAVQSTYGYEFQGDNLLLARENILYTFIDNMQHKFEKEPTIVQIKKIANIISWNLWQMDGLTYTIPYGEMREAEHQMSIFGFLVSEEEEKDDKIKVNPDAPSCRIRDWRAEETIEFRTLLEGAK
ncbi:MAG: restriction endonuclease subunit M [Acetobacterium sp.]|uniref:restriction endonuclease subunit M n=1 Tax=Acetobacterium sp. TaxID=1872094 RepID=UPI003242FBB7